MLKGLKMKYYHRGFSCGFEEGALWERRKKDIVPHILKSPIMPPEEPEEPKTPKVASNEEPQTIPEILESVKEAICDRYCKWPNEYKNEEDMWNEMCAKCPLNRLS